MQDTYSVAAGLDYIGIGPMLADLHQKGRVRFESATDTEVIAAMRLTMRNEGIVPALGSAHAFVGAFRDASNLSADKAILINQSGRGNKDIFTIADALGDEDWKDFVRRTAERYAR